MLPQAQSRTDEGTWRWQVNGESPSRGGGNGPQTLDIGVQACDLHRSFPDGENQEGVFSRGNSMYKGVMKCLAHLIIYFIVIVCLID